MNYVKSCVFIAMLAGIGYACQGDVNDDGSYNVLDVVALANCVLAANCDDLGNTAWCADMNADGSYNVLDIVLLVNCVLTGNCDGPFP